MLRRDVIVALAWVVAAFVAGALPFSVWIGRLALHTDIRAYGDGNPGATNVFRAGGRGWGIVAVALDFLKAALPVGLAHYAGGLSGWALAAVALAPIAGHAFSPFLGFRGGKALAATFGAWTGLTLWVVPVALGLLFTVWYRLLTTAGWAVMVAMFCLLPLLALLREPALFGVWVGNALVLGWKHRVDLAAPPRLRSITHL